MKRLNDDQVCFICKRRADGIGVGTLKHAGWTCADCKPDLAKEALRMSDKDFDVYEKRALVVAGGKAGEYLDSLGVTDLAKLQPDEWQAFLALAINSFGDAIRSEIDSNKAPF